MIIAKYIVISRTEIAPAEDNVTVWWFAILRYPLQLSNQRITDEVYCQYLNKKHNQLSKMTPALVNQRNSILIYDTTRPPVTRITLQMLTDLGYERLAPLEYSFDLSPTA